ncbi:UNVERIFIED_CONTAM: hypothetical protein BJ099_109179 [Lysinibacillus xylanilyticus]
MDVKEVILVWRSLIILVLVLLLISKVISLSLFIAIISGIVLFSIIPDTFKKIFKKENN